MGLVEKIKPLIPPEMTIADFEIATGLSKNSFYRLDKNKPRIDCVVEMAKILNVSVDYLVGLTDEKKPVPTDGNGLSPARVALLTAVDGMSEDEIYHLLKVIEAVKGK